MASLEELLADEGFKKGSQKQRPRESAAASRAVSMPLRSDREQNHLLPTMKSRFQRARAGSDVLSRGSRSNWSDKGRGRGASKEESLEMEGFETSGSNCSLEDGGFGGRLWNPRSNSVDESRMRGGREIKETKGMIGRYKIIYNNDMNDNQELQRGNIRKFQMQPSFNDGIQCRRDDATESFSSELKLDEVAIHAVVSISTSYVRQFFKDENFRASIGHSCATCLGIDGATEKNKENDTLVANFKEAIQIVENVVKQGLDSKGLKKASLKLTLITGLNSKDMHDGLTSGIPNSYLAACSHLYLSIIYKHQKKDKISARHIFQVFSSSPSQARSNLLPGLWDRLFLPNLSHLRSWYDQEVQFIAQISTTERKMKLLDKMYNDALDKGTHNFAAYYKEWLMEETKAPALPFIHPPSSASYQGISRDSFKSIKSIGSDVVCHSTSSISSQLLVGKRLYQSIFSQSGKMDVVDEMEGRKEEEEESRNYSPKSRIQKHIAEHSQEYHSPFSQELNSSAYLSSIEYLEPVTLETGHTFERVAIKEWFDQSNKTCPVSGPDQECLIVSDSNFVVKHLIDSWKSEHCKNLSLFTPRVARSMIKQDRKSKDESALSVTKNLLMGFIMEEQLKNARHLVALGGLDFLLCRFELGNLEEKVHIVELMLCCIRADGCYRNYLAAKLNSSCILELLHSKQVGARANTVLLLIELLCLKRRTTLSLFLKGFHTEAITSTMHVLLVYLQSSGIEERALAAILLLHFDLMVEPSKCSIYREEAISSIVLALNFCLSDKNIVPNSRKALLMLGGHFSFSGDLLIEIWMLQQAGYFGGCAIASTDDDDKSDENAQDKETTEQKNWLMAVTLALLGNGRRSFLEALCKCLDSCNAELVRSCLTTVAWLSHSLVSLSTAEIQLTAFSALIPRLRRSLENNEQIQDRVLASASLLNFSKIPECRVLLMSFADEIGDLLKELFEVTWTAKQLYATIDG
ncbi:uncharacterized protein [Typha latifolia]|uniref:uncharacterized protein n=1 Tax=Typha latifolia TaxID=4733 RepID=UPI003C2EEBD9